MTDEHRRRLILPFQALHAEALSIPGENGELTLRAESEPFFRAFIEPAITEKPNSGTIASV
ncbi:MAG: hypothetical protein K9N48_04130 [Verrucomicrobia bacterium]|nr:hypothetical protein [Verrucomicrobiota bacterium]